MLHTGAGSGCDGAPSETISRIKEENPGQYDLVRNDAGGFHQKLKFWGMRGRAYEETHLYDLTFTWRNSPGKVWFLTRPGDTTQVENETPEYLLAHYACSAIGASNVWKDRAEPKPVFDARYVHKHMVERAQECPLAMVVLMELMVTQAIMAMKGANRPCAICW
jgi:hypothetical protein